MPPMATWYRGRDRVRIFLADWAFAKRWTASRGRFEEGERRVRLVPARRERADGPRRVQPRRRERRSTARTRCRCSPCDGGRISQIDGFVAPEHFPAFGLPDVLEPAG